MQCVNHPEIEAKAFCQSCGKALCPGCIRSTASGQVLCEPCLAAAGADPSQAYWQQAAQAYVVTPRGLPNPSAAAVLGLIPGVGAMYNGQFFKALIHVVVFAVLISMTQSYGIFGIFIGAWVLYQSFEAFHTAKARRDGLPLPDPFGLNELGSWLNLGGNRSQGGVPPGPFPHGSVPPTGAPAAPGTEPPAYSAPYTSSWSTGPIPGPAPGQPVDPAASPEAGYTPPYSAPYAGPNPQGYTDPYAGNYPPGSIPPVPPVPPVPPYGWRGREPVWAVVLIVLGLMFLLKTLGFVGHLFHFAWPLLLIGFGVWMIIRRLGYLQGGSK